MTGFTIFHGSALEDIVQFDTPRSERSLSTLLRHGETLVQRAIEVRAEVQKMLLLSEGASTTLREKLEDLMSCADLSLSEIAPAVATTNPGVQADVCGSWMQLRGTPPKPPKPPKATKGRRGQRAA